MAIKYDIPDTYLNEYTKYQELFLLGAIDRGALPSGTFVSTSSSTSYPYTDGNDLFSQLQTVLTNFIVTASDWNSLEDTITEKLKAIALGGLVY